MFVTLYRVKTSVAKPELTTPLKGETPSNTKINTMAYDLVLLFHLTWTIREET